MTTKAAALPIREDGGWFRWYRPAMLGLSVVVIAIGLALFAAASGSHTWPVFDDLRIVTESAARLFSGEPYYLPMQTAGPYPLTHGVVLYPPVASLFFAPWLMLPAWTFVAIPVGILAWFVVSCRPAPWAWPVIAFGAVFPVTLLYVVFANPSLWIAAFAALGLRRGWPAALILLKPSLAPFALIGIRDRRWWAVVAALAVLSLPWISETLMYPRVIFDGQGGGLTYSGMGIPLMLVPLAAWLARQRRN